jgi:hypothetical protein
LALTYSLAAIKKKTKKAVVMETAIGLPGLSREINVPLTGRFPDNAKHAKIELCITVLCDLCVNLILPLRFMDFDFFDTPNDMSFL